MFGLIPISCIIFMVEFFHVLGFSISSMDVIILLFVVSSLHSMLIRLLPNTLVESSRVEFSRLNLVESSFRD